jgi:hypothetical protein
MPAGANPSAGKVQDHIAFGAGSQSVDESTLNLHATAALAAGVQSSDGLQKTRQPSHADSCTTSKFFKERAGEVRTIG